MSLALSGHAPFQRRVSTIYNNNPSSLPTSEPSALIGQPPANLRDYYIIKGLLRMAMLNDANPMMGYFLATKAPSGYVYESRGTGILIGMVIVILALVIPTMTRLVLRKRINQMEFGWDDWTILAAMSLALVYPSLQIDGVLHGGGGKHTWDNTYAQYDRGNLTGTICKVIFYESVGLIKISIALFIRRLTNHTLLRWRWFCNIFIISVVVFMLLALFWTLFTCSPPQIQWSIYERGRHNVPPVCVNMKLQSQVLGGIHLAQGLILSSAPIFILWKVRMNRAKKIRLFIYWGTGGITILGGLLRSVRPGGLRDMTWEYVEVLAWTCVDLVMGIFTASLPVLDGAMSGVWHRAATSFGNSKGVGRGYMSHDNAYPQESVQTTDQRASKAKVQSESSESIVGKFDKFELGIVGTKEREVEAGPASSLSVYTAGKTSGKGFDR